MNDERSSRSSGKAGEVGMRNESDHELTPSERDDASDAVDAAAAPAPSPDTGMPTGYGRLAPGPDA